MPLLIDDISNHDKYKLLPTTIHWDPDKYHAVQFFILAKEKSTLFITLLVADGKH